MTFYASRAWHWARAIEEVSGFTIDIAELVWCSSLMEQETILQEDCLTTTTRYWTLSSSEIRLSLIFPRCVAVALLKYQG